MVQKRGSGELKEDSFEGYYEEETYTKGLNREDTIEGQVRTINYFYSRRLFSEFEYSLKILIALLPKMIRDKFPPEKYDISPDGIEKHYQQFVKIQEFLETGTNLIFKKKFIKTYE